MRLHINDIPDYEGIGIYSIKNIENGKRYIGSSINVAKRIQAHMTKPPLQMIDDISSGDSFSVEILEKIPFGVINRYDLIDKENHYIKTFNSIKNGYNRQFACISSENSDIEQIKYWEKHGDKEKVDLCKSRIQQRKSLILKPEKPIKEKLPVFHVTLRGSIARYKAAAADAGLSMAQFFVTAADEKIERDGLKTE